MIAQIFFSLLLAGIIATSGQFLVAAVAAVCGVLFAVLDE